MPFSGDADDAEAESPSLCPTMVPMGTEMSGPGKLIVSSCTVRGSGGMSVVEIC